MEPRVLFVALGVKKWSDGTEHVVFLGVFHTEKEATAHLDKNEIPQKKRNVVSVFEGAGHCINVFAI